MPSDDLAQWLHVDVKQECGECKHQDPTPHKWKWPQRKKENHRNMVPSTPNSLKDARFVDIRMPLRYQELES